ncbi:MAG: 2,4-dienoyl-CoA reductase [Actinobacteria bacterium]|nr:2,4-dienoyl-CoA reductase [Actinomycetota bacterium]
MRGNDILFTPVKIGNLTAQNRIALNSMECNDADSDGNPTKKTYERYTKYFEGNAGLIDLEAITVTDESRGRLYQLSVMPKNEKALKKFVQEMKKVNNKPIFIWQITHSGELSHPDFSRRVCVKPLGGFGGDLLSEEDIDDIMNKFVLAAKIAHESGADGIDFKLCHGYLCSQLLRPYNDRKWKYGGSWENRKRFALETYEKIANEISDPNFIVGSKISIWEGFPGGFGSAGPDTAIIDYTEPVDLIKGLEERGAKFIMVSAGSPSITLALSQPDKRIPDQVYLHHTFQKVVSDAVKPDTVVIGSAYSIFRDGNNNLQPQVPKEEKCLTYWANKNISEGVCDMIALGRQSLADCLLPKKFEEGREDEINWCIACDNCVELLIRQQNVGCITYNKESAKALRNIRKKEGLLKWKLT